MIALSESRRRLLQLIWRRTRARRVSFTMRQLGAMLGWTSSHAVWEQVHKLESLGLVTQERGKKRTLRTTEAAAEHLVPPLVKLMLPQRCTACRAEFYGERARAQHAVHCQAFQRYGR